ncbi:MAG TPA: hypothetical protein VEL07_09520 [Planctomycetota bacterium]|nr:hypothetical protein [Planctomycetota bacterium]
MRLSINAPQDAPALATRSCFGSLLKRGADGWSWLDGDRERRVSDVPECCDALCRYAASPTALRVVEVPFSLVSAYDELAWIVRAMARGDHLASIAIGASHDDGPPWVGTRGADIRALAAIGTTVVLVPEWQWLSWRRGCPVLPCWHADDEADLFVRARNLGWRE